MECKRSIEAVMNPLYLFLLFLILPLSASAINIGENTTFNITNASISVCDFSCSSLIVNHNSIDVDAFSFGINPTNGSIDINNFSISNNIMFNVNSIISDNPVWFNCTHPLWIKNDINIYVDSVLLTTIYTPSGTINYQYDQGFSEKTFKFSISDESIFKDIIDMLVEIVDIFSPILTIVLKLIPILIVLAIIPFIVGLITSILNKIRGII